MVPVTPPETLAPALAHERVINARRVAIIRVVTAIVYLSLYFVFGRVLDLEVWRGGDVPMLFYSLSALMILVGTRRSERFARASGSLVPVVDVPFAFVLQLTMLQSATNQPSVVAFNVATMMLIVLLSSLWLLPRLVVATALAGALAQSVLFIRIGMHPAIAASVFTMLLLGAAGCAYGATRIIKLLGSLMSQLSAEEALRLRARDLELTNQRMQETARVKDRFLATMSHELRTPLNAVIGFSELLETGEGTAAEQKEFARDISNSGRHLLSLINAMLDMARVESGRVDLQIEHVSVAPIVADIVSAMRIAADKKRIALDVEQDPALGSVYVDPQRLRQVLYNYLSNAVKFTPEGGRIVLRTKKDGDRFLIEVQDNGIGISAEDLPTLFTEYHRLRSADAIEGTGLGLALTKRLVEALGGHVLVSSELNVGSMFTARLPIDCTHPS